MDRILPVLRLKPPLSLDDPYDVYDKDEIDAHHDDDWDAKEPDTWTRVHPASEKRHYHIKKITKIWRKKKNNNNLGHQYT